MVFGLMSNPWDISFVFTGFIATISFLIMVEHLETDTEDDSISTGEEGDEEKFRQDSEAGLSCPNCGELYDSAENTVDDLCPVCEDGYISPHNTTMDMNSLNHD